MSAVVLQQPGMPSVMDAINPPASFSARKTAVSSVPVPGRIDLPVNPVTQKFANSMSSTASLQHGSINSLLTPPSNISGDSLSPISSSATSVTQQGPASHGIPPFTPNGSWAGPSGSGLTPMLASGTGATTQSWGSSSLNFPPPKNMFSPLGNLIGTSNSPIKSDALPPPPYNLGDLHPLPPFATSAAPMASTMASHANGMPATHPGHQLGCLPLGSQAPLTAAAVSAVSAQPNPLSSSDSFLRAPPTPASPYYGSHSSSTPIQSQFSYPSASPPALSPPARISPLNSGSNFAPPPPLSGPPHGTGQQHQPFGSRSSFSSYGSPLGMMSGHHMGNIPPYPINSGAAVARMQSYYDQNGHPHGMLGAPQMAHNDRPFKCDQCPQSFNRNHDLKRHKRIHLAVKPFPCGFCDKSFSRKDALKRHILVKGCGKATAGKDDKNGHDMDDNASSKSDSD